MYGYIIKGSMINVVHLPIIFMIVSQVRKCLNEKEQICGLLYIGTIDQYQTTTNHKDAQSVCIMRGMYCITKTDSVTAASHREGGGGAWLLLIWPALQKITSKIASRPT